MEEMWGTGFAGSSPPFFGRERAAVDVDVGPERREKVGFTKNTARRHRRVGGRAVTVTAMLSAHDFNYGTLSTFAVAPPHAGAWSRGHGQG